MSVPPFSVSLPASPVSVSFPAPPRSVSLPPRPSRAFGPALPVRVSLPLQPTRFSVELMRSTPAPLVFCQSLTSRLTPTAADPGYITVSIPSNPTRSSPPVPPISVSFPGIHHRPYKIRDLPPQPPDRKS